MVDHPALPQGSASECSSLMRDPLYEGMTLVLAKYCVWALLYLKTTTPPNPYLMTLKSRQFHNASHHQACQILSSTSGCVSRTGPMAGGQDWLSDDLGPSLGCALCLCSALEYTKEGHSQSNIWSFQQHAEELGIVWWAASPVKWCRWARSWCVFLNTFWGLVFSLASLCDLRQVARLAISHFPHLKMRAVEGVIYLGFLQTLTACYLWWSSLKVAFFFQYFKYSYILSQPQPSKILFPWMRRECPYERDPNPVSILFMP